MSTVFFHPINFSPNLKKSTSLCQLNFSSDILRKKILIKEDCIKDKRVKKIIPSQVMIEEWSKLKNAVLSDLDEK